MCRWCQSEKYVRVHVHTKYETVYGTIGKKMHAMNIHENEKFTARKMANKKTKSDTISMYAFQIH